MLVDKASTNLFFFFFDFERAHSLDNVYSYMFSSPLLCIKNLPFVISQERSKRRVLNCWVVATLISCQAACIAMQQIVIAICRATRKKTKKYKKKKKKEKPREKLRKQSKTPNCFL